MNKHILKIIGLVLMFSLIAFAFYPRPIEIITLFLIGLSILFLAAFIYKKIVPTQQMKENRRKKLLEYAFQTLLIIFSIAFLLVFRVSWVEKKLVLNIFQTQTGKAYFAITVGVFLVFILYYLLFYKRHRRWPKDKDLGI
jgi:predicted membrane channel-forming protein YqfA (hemolysin III family)